MQPNLPLRDAVLRGDWPAADRNLTPAELTALDQFGAKVRRADRAQFAAWGINSPRLVADVKSLFNTEWAGAR